MPKVSDSIFFHASQSGDQARDYFMPDCGNSMQSLVGGADRNVLFNPANDLPDPKFFLPFRYRSPKL
jgi:hypothetical protein